MGRGKIDIKWIENSTNRPVMSSKCRNQIMKKAREISVLCESEIYVVVFSSLGKMSELPKMLEKYQQHSGKKLWEAKHEDFNSKELDDKHKKFCPCRVPTSGSQLLLSIERIEIFRSNFDSDLDPNFETRVLILDGKLLLAERGILENVVNLVELHRMGLKFY